MDDRAPKTEEMETAADEAGREPEAPEAELPPSPERDRERAVEEELEHALDHLKEEFDSLNDRHLRLAAEFDNYRKRAQTEMSETWNRAQADLVRRLLEPLDDLQRVSGLEPESATVEAIVEGVDLVERKVHRALVDAGVDVVEPEGERFDPNTMEAMMKVPTDSEEEDDRVHQVLQRGYTFKGHLVRPARVSVLKHE